MHAAVPPHAAVNVRPLDLLAAGVHGFSDAACRLVFLTTVVLLAEARFVSRYPIIGDGT